MQRTQHHKGVVGCQQIHDLRCPPGQCREQQSAVRNALRAGKAHNALGVDNGPEIDMVRKMLLVLGHSYGFLVCVLTLFSWILLINLIAAFPGLFSANSMARPQFWRACCALA